MGRSIGAGNRMEINSSTTPAIERPITQASIEIHDARAPWFFLWVQQLLKAGDAFLFGVAAPVLLLLGLGILPYILPQAQDHEFGRWFPRGNRIAQIVIILVALAIIILTVLAVLPTTQL